MQEIECAVTLLLRCWLSLMMSAQAHHPASCQSTHSANQLCKKPGLIPNVLCLHPASSSPAFTSLNPSLRISTSLVQRPVGLGCPSWWSAACACLHGSHVTDRHTCSSPFPSCSTPARQHPFLQPSNCRRSHSPPSRPPENDLHRQGGGVVGWWWWWREAVAHYRLALAPGAHLAPTGAWRPQRATLSQALRPDAAGPTRVHRTANLAIVPPPSTPPRRAAP